MLAPGRDAIRLLTRLVPDPVQAARLLLDTDFNADTAEMLADLLGPIWADPNRRQDIDVLLNGHGGHCARYAAARLAQQSGQAEQAARTLVALQADLPSPDAVVALHLARIQAGLGQIGQAADTLRQALTLGLSYAHIAKSEKLTAKLMAAAEWQPRRHLKLAVLGSSTTAFLSAPLTAACFRDGIRLSLYHAPYGTIIQEIGSPDSGLYAFGPDMVLIMVNHQDLALPCDGGKSQAMAWIDDIRASWATLQARQPCHIVQLAFDLPETGAWGGLEDILPQGRRRVITEANLRLTDDLPPGVSIIDPTRITNLAQQPLWSAVEWSRTRQYPAPLALPALAELVTAQCRAVLGLTSKVLVLDLDNTLWGGVIGEDGITGIVLGAPDPAGEAHQALQRYALDLKNRGILLAICSKNNLADAQLPFQQHDSMVLSLDDFVDIRANWDDKASNIKAMAEHLRLGLDAFVFLDDNPLERAWVRASLPQVAVPDHDGTPWGMLDALRNGLYFEATALTDEDKARTDSYRATAQLAQSGDTADFLDRLAMRVRHGAVEALTLPRCTQLINKTNQFNLTTRRYTETEMQALAHDPNWWCRWFRLSDRFGDHGLVGLILARRGADEWDVDSWLMSCRVLGRRMEEFMAATLLTAARKAGAVRVRARYCPTPKNALVSDLLPRLGFQPDGPSGEAIWRLDQMPPPACPFIQAEESVAEESVAEESVND